MAKLEGGGDSLYDICVPSDYIIPALIKNGLLAPLRKDNIPNMKNIDPKFGNREYDLGNKFTAPYQWGTVGLYVHKKPGETIDETWGLIFDPKKSIGSFLMIDDTRGLYRRRAQVQGLQPQHHRQETTQGSARPAPRGQETLARFRRRRRHQEQGARQGLQDRHGLQRRRRPRHEGGRPRPTSSSRAKAAKSGSTTWPFPPRPPTATWPRNSSTTSSTPKSARNCRTSTNTPRPTSPRGSSSPRRI